jgi:hypothetical protein
MEQHVGLADVAAAAAAIQAGRRALIQPSDQNSPIAPIMIGYPSMPANVRSSKSVRCHTDRIIRLAGRLETTLRVKATVVAERTRQCTWPAHDAMLSGAERRGEQRRKHACGHCSTWLGGTELKNPETSIPSGSGTLFGYERSVWTPMISSCRDTPHGERRRAVPPNSSQSAAASCELVPVTWPIHVPLWSATMPLGTLSASHARISCRPTTGGPAAAGLSPRFILTCARRNHTAAVRCRASE